MISIIFFEPKIRYCECLTGSFFLLQEVSILLDNGKAFKIGLYC